MTQFDYFLCSDQGHLLNGLEQNDSCAERSVSDLRDILLRPAGSLTLDVSLMPSAQCIADYVANGGGGLSSPAVFRSIIETGSSPEIRTSPWPGQIGLITFAGCAAGAPPR